MMSFLKKAMDLQKNIKEAQERFEKEEISISAAGGAVVVKVKGTMMLAGIEIDEGFLKETPAGVLQETLVNAVNEGIQKIKDMREKELKDMTADLKIPGMPGMPGIPGM